MSVRTEPLSIESLLQKQKAEKEAASKVIRCSPQIILFLHPNPAQIPFERGTSKTCNSKTCSGNTRAERKGGELEV
jgi:hypothetical protein